MSGNARRRAIFVLAAASAARLGSSSAWATDKYYVGPGNGTGSWSNGANWSLSQGGPGGAGAPVAGDFLYIRHFDSGFRNLVYDVNIVNPPYLTRIRMGNSAGGLITITQNSNFNLTVIGEAVGSTGTITSGTGVHTQSAGTNTYTNFLSLGDDPGTGIGTYNLSGTGAVVISGTDPAANPGLYVGTNEKGVFNQNGGAVTVAANSLLDVGFGGVGTYNLVSGNLTVNGAARIGDTVPGTFNQSGGTNTCASLTLGNNSGGKGTYLLSDTGSLVLTGNLSIGAHGLGTFNQSGGAATIGTPAATKNLVLGSNAGSGTYLLSNGALTVNGDETLGGDSSVFGFFNQTGGTNTVTGTLWLANDNSAVANGSGTYLLSGGNLNVNGTEIVGYIGTEDPGQGALFNQTGGSHTIGTVAAPANLLVGYSHTTGTYELSSTGSLSASGEYIGVFSGGIGYFNQNGGTNIVGAGGLHIGCTVLTTSYGEGNYVLNAGVLSVNGDVSLGVQPAIGADPEKGLLTISGGSMTVAGTVKILNGDSQILLNGGALATGALDATAAPSRFNWTSGQLRITGSTIDVGALSRLGAVFTPTLSLTAGRGLIADVGITIAPGGALNLQGGSLSATNLSNFGNFNQTSGSLSISGVFSNSGTANFGATQSWGPSSVFVNSAGVATFGTALNASGFVPVVVVTGGSVNFNASPGPLARLAITAAPVTLSPGGDKTMVVQSVSIDSAPGGKLDLFDHDLITAGTSLSTIAAYITSGFNGGSWNGIGITSTKAAAVPANNPHKTALGYATASSIGVTLFDGQSVSGSTVLVRYTFSGDANLDRVVNGLDFNALSLNFDISGGNWVQGDFNFDGFVNALDFNAIATNFGSALPDPPAFAVAVPEPCIWLLAAWVPNRRRRKR